jgi:hypothetical protein
VNARAQAPVDAITLRLTSVLGQRVILDSDLAALYGVETKRLNEAVKRNQARFPADFMVALSQEEWERLRSQIATLDAGRGQHRKRAVDVSVYVVRAFVRLPELAAAHGDMAKRLDELEAKTEALTLSHQAFGRETRAQIKHVFDALRALMTPPDPPRRPIGFVAPKEDVRKASNRRARHITA